MAPQLDDDMTLTTLAKYGGYAVFAGYLIYVLTQGIGRDVRDVRDAMQVHAAATVELKRSMETDERWHATMVDVMRQLCINSAKTYGERAACFQAGVK